MPLPLFDYEVFLQNTGAAAQAQINAADNAAEFLTTASDENISLLSGISDDIKASFAPFIQAGNKGLREFQNLTGVNGADAQAASTERVLSSPQVQQQLGVGVNAIERSASAGGSLRSGRILEDLFKFGRDLSVSEISRNQDQLFNLAGLGVNALNTQSGFVSQLGRDQATARNFGAEGQANAAIAKGNASANFFTTLGQIDLQKQMDRALLGGLIPPGQGGSLGGGSLGGAQQQSNFSSNQTFNAPLGFGQSQLGSGAVIDQPRPGSTGQFVAPLPGELF